MLQPWRLGAVSVVCLFLTGCGGSEKDTAKPAARAVTSVQARPLSVRSDGTLDPHRIDLSGIAGVSHSEQLHAQDLLRQTILAMPRWNDVAQAKRGGFVSIGDGFSGAEHYVHWDWIEDDVIFDPRRPESLVYRVEPNGKRILEAAMFILPERYRLDNTPDIGGKLVQFHVHDNLCFTDSPAPKFTRLARLDGTCTPPLVKRLTNTMTHVWIRPNPCGPFAAVGGFANGTVKDGEQVACDFAHGSESDF